MIARRSRATLWRQIKQGVQLEGKVPGIEYFYKQYCCTIERERAIE
jgi:hypothetical protein